MKNIFVIILISLAPSLMSAQIGMSLIYQNNHFSDWNLNTPLFQNAGGIGVDYWFRLKNHRLEIFPGIKYQHSESNNISGLEGNAIWKKYSFSLKIKAYIFDFISDCNCPTFSKQNEFFKKGFFVYLDPKFSRHIMYDNSEKEETQIEMNNVNASGGMGFDFGISNYLTISPFIGMSLYPNIQWDLLDNNNESNNDIWGFELGVRIGLRWDTQNFY